MDRSPGFGPLYDLYRPSSDSISLRLPFLLRGLTSPHTITRWTVLQKERSTISRLKIYLSGKLIEVSGSLSPGSLHLTVLVSLIDLPVVFSLTGMVPTLSYEISRNDALDSTYPNLSFIYWTFTVFWFTFPDDLIRELSVTVIGLRKNSQLLPKNCLPLSNTVIIVLSVWDLLVIHGLLFGMVFINATCSKKA